MERPQDNNNNLPQDNNNNLPQDNNNNLPHREEESFEIEDNIRETKMLIRSANHVSRHGTKNDIGREHLSILQQNVSVQDFLDGEVLKQTDIKKLTNAMVKRLESLEEELESATAVHERERLEHENERGVNCPLEEIENLSLISDSSSSSFIFMAATFLILKKFFYLKSCCFNSRYEEKPFHNMSIANITIVFSTILVKIPLLTIIYILSIKYIFIFLPGIITCLSISVRRGLVAGKSQLSLKQYGIIFATVSLFSFFLGWIVYFFLYILF